MRTLKICILTLFASCFVLVATAQITPTVLWKISGNGLTKPSFFFGTNHVTAYDSFIARYPVIDSVLQLSHSLLVENVPEAGEGSVDRDVLYFNNSDSTIKDLLSAQQYQKLTAYIKTKSDSNPDVLANLTKMRPKLLLLAIQMLAAGTEELESNNVQNIDAGLVAAAKARGKLLIGLETAKERSLALVENSSDQKAIEEIMETVQPSVSKKKRIPKTKQKVAAPADNYASLQIYYYFDMDPTETEGGVLIRNRSWIRKIPALLAANNSLIAVGLDHLKGPIGLIQQLRKLGYIIEPISMISVKK